MRAVAAAVILLVALLLITFAVRGTFRVTFQIGGGVLLQEPARIPVTPPTHTSPNNTRT